MKGIINFIINLLHAMIDVILGMVQGKDSLPRRIVRGFQTIATVIVTSYYAANTNTKKVLAFIAACLLLSLTVIGFTLFVVAVALAILNPYKLTLLAIGALVMNRLFNMQIKASTENGGSVELEVTPNGK